MVNAGFASCSLHYTGLCLCVRYRQLTDELQLQRDALNETAASREVQLQQQSAEIQQLHDKV